MKKRLSPHVLIGGAAKEKTSQRNRGKATRKREDPDSEESQELDEIDRILTRAEEEEGDTRTNKAHS